MDNLRRKCSYVIKWCYMCRSDGETYDHLFIHCDCVRWLWNNILASQHIDWVLPRCIEDVLFGIARLFGILSRNALYGVCGEKNNRCF